MLVVGLIACSAPTRPSVSIAATRGVLPPDGTVIGDSGQSITLTVQNAVTTQPTVPVSDTFEVATDLGFAHIVVTKTVPQSAGPQTSVTLDPLPPSSYYWRVRADANGAIAISAPGAFRVLPVLAASRAVVPENGVLIGHADQPVTLAVENPVMPTSVTTITDTFEVATDPSFTVVGATQTVPQAAGARTSVTLSALAGGVTYYWRVRAAATDAIGATSTTAMFRMGPATVSGPYQFTIALGTSCPNGYANVLLFHGELTVASGTWQFRGSDDPGGNTPPPLGPDILQLVLNPRRTILSGTVQAKGKWVDNAPFYLYFGTSDFSPPPTLPVSGSVSPDGVIEGTFGGELDLLHRTYSIRSFCPGTWHWTLSPR
jgi:hypothetical protein